MRVYNHSGIPDRELRCVLSMAVRAVGVRSKDLVVVVRTRRATSPYTVGRAYDLREVNSWFLEGSSSGARPAPDGFHGPVECNGCVRLDVPAVRRLWPSDKGWDSTLVAVSLYMAACHEFSHIKDFQDHRWTPEQYEAGKKLPHDERPWERRAERVAIACSQIGRMPVCRIKALAQLADAVRNMQWGRGHGG